jgi:alkanesulfonate monooxygenase SsuD/methylene tetrahydromethanopterin reductase-like flavin-dependent oxidoreductase (luciferase family)
MHGWFGFVCGVSWATYRRQPLRFGFFGINTGPCAAPETAAKVARAAEAAGFESVWTGPVRKLA